MRPSTLTQRAPLPAQIDDLGFADTQVRNPYSPTPHIGQLADLGINLEHHHAYRWCSPTRRSILSGRFPVSISGQQAPTCSNYLRAPRQSRQPIFLLLE